ncbi:MAG TPA: hypothetical protein VH601_23605 [Bryobacteraceae bacterium]
MSVQAADNQIEVLPVSPNDDRIRAAQEYVPRNISFKGLSKFSPVVIFSL